MTHTHAGPADWAALLGRWMIALLFVLSALKKCFAPAATIATIGATGAPFPTLGFVLALAIEIFGSVALIVGWRVRGAAIGLAVFCIASGILIHAHPDDPAQMTHLFKNIAITGGLLQLVAFGAGRISLSARSAHRGE